MIWLLCSLAFGGTVRLDEPAVAREDVVVGETTYTAPQPIYLLPTPSFDRLLEDAKKLRACEEGLEDAESALVTAQGALTDARTQMELDEANDLEQMKTIFQLQEDLGKARAQRNVAVALAGGVAAGVVAAALLSR